MKILIPLFIVLFYFSLPSSFSQITFEKTFGGVLGGYSMSFSKTMDDGYIIAGNTTYWATSDIYVIRINVDGTMKWAKTYGGTGEDRAYSIKQTIDGGFIIGGHTKSFTTGGDAQIYLIKTDSTGNIHWSKTYGDSLSDRLRSVCQTSDSGYIIAGYTDSYGAGNSDVYVIKVNSIGDTMWTKTYGGSSFDYANSVIETNDGGYIIVGDTWNFGAGAIDIYVIKIDKNGNTLWIKAYGGTGSDSGYSINQTTDNGFIIAGSTLSFGAGSYDAYLIKTDSLGIVQWSKTYGSPPFDFFHSAQQTTDGGYILIGRTRASYNLSPRGYEVYVIKTDSNGDTLWTRTYGGDNNEERTSGYQTFDGGYIIAGETYSFGNPDWKFYLIKTDEYGNNVLCNGFSSHTTVTNPITLSGSGGMISYGANVDTVITQVNNISVADSSVCSTVSVQDKYKPLYTTVKVYPNPANDYIIIEFQTTTTSTAHFSLYNSTGTLTLHISGETFTKGTHRQQINTQHLFPGIYLLLANINNHLQTIKILKL